MRVNNRTITSRILVLVCLLAGVVSFPSRGLAQQFRGAVTGVITDSAGAAVSGAKVELTNTDTGVLTPAVTNESGVYSVDLLPIGPYDIRVTMTGFETAVSQVILHGGDRLQMDIRLHPGGESQTVTVTDTAPQLETTTGSSGQTLDQTEISNSPLLGRNPFAMAMNLTGVTIPPGQNPATALRPYDNGGMDSYVINGGLSETTEYLLDGLTDSGVDTGGPANLSWVPSPDMVAESTVATTVYDAQYGRSGGGIISVNLKSGTNDLHGVASYYLRNEMFNANTYAADTIGARKAEFRWNEPGVVVSGPVVLPKLYNGRDKTFFMFGWEEIHNNIPAPTSSTVPTALERQGNFSESYNGGPLPIYDPLTTKQNADGSYSRTAFADDQIPTNRLDPVALKIVALLPLPNLPNAGNVNNLLSTPDTSTDKYDSFVYRVDQNINEHHRIFGAFMYADRHQDQGLNGYPAAIAPSYLHYRKNHASHVDWTWTISPTLVSSFRVGWNEHEFAITNHQQSYDLTTLGFPAATVAGLSDPTLFPYISIANYSSFGNSGFGNGIFNTSNTYDLAETIIKNLKTHDLNFGVEVRPARDSRSWFQASTDFGFGTDFTQENPLTAQTDSGSAFASFLLGYPDSGSTSSNPRPYYSNGYYAIYGEDFWRVNNRLSLTLGLRWDTETPEIESHNLQNTGFDPDASYTFANQQLHGEVLFAGNGNARGAYRYDRNDFGPRAGFAYRLTSKAALRGGVGVLYAPVFNLPSEVGYSVSTTYIASTNNLLTPANVLSNPFPSGFVQPLGAGSNLTGQGGWTYWRNNHANIPRVVESSLGIQYQFPGQTLLDVHYALGLTRNIAVGRNANFLPTADLALGDNLNNQVANPFSGLLPGTSLDSSTVSLEQTLLPFPQYTSFTVNDTNGATAYNSLQVTVEKRITHGAYARLAYTFSKSMSEGYLNDQDTHFTSELSPNDQPQVLAITAGYNVPNIGNVRNPVVKQLLGWQINGVFTAYSGMLYTAPAGVTATGVDPRVSHPTFSHEFNTCTIDTDGTLQNCNLDNGKAAWKVVPPYTLASLNPYYGDLRMHVPPLLNANISKIFPIGERFKLQFRAEFFNISNTPQFGVPNTSYSSSTFGQMTNFAQINDPREIQFALRLNF